MLTIANIRPFGHNVGNHTIGFSIRQMLYEVFGRLVTVIEYPASAKYETLATAGLSKKSVNDINRFTDGVIVGGGNLYENDEIDIHPTALAAIQPPLMLFSISRGRVYGRKDKLIDRSDVIDDRKLELLFSRANISLSRDSATHRYITKLGLRDELGWCPTINANRYSHLIPELPEKEFVGTLISVRTPGLMNVPFRYQARIQEDIESAIDQLRENGHKRIRILCNDSRDLDFATLFRHSRRVDSIFTNDVYTYLGLLRGAEMVICYRLHASLPALSMGKRTINITYDERAKSLFDDLKFSSGCLDMIDLGDRFRPKLMEKIDKGGDTLQSIPGVALEWNRIGEFQFEKLHEFKRLVEMYVRS